MTRGRPSLRDVAFLGIAIAFIGLRLFDVPPWNQSVDAYAYWRPITDGTPYSGAAVGELGSYLYSRGFKLLVVPLGALPWPIFNALDGAELRRPAIGGRRLLPGPAPVPTSPVRDHLRQRPSPLRGGRRWE